MTYRSLTITLIGVAMIAGAAERPLVVGSKKDTEGRVLGEIIAQLMEDRGFTVERRLGLGGTLICFEALRTNEIDVYPEYSGTIAQAFFKSGDPLSYEEIQRQVQERYHFQFLEPFGFNNTYAMTTSRSWANEHGVRSISDLVRYPELRFGVSHEFLNRPDGWPGLARHYRLRATPVGIEHGLAYRAISEGKIDVTDAYSTDGELITFDLAVLSDDRGFFPPYLAAPLIRGDFNPRAQTVLTELAETLNDHTMQQLNARAGKGDEFDVIARDFLRERGLLQQERSSIGESWASKLFRRTMVHLQLTAVAVFAAAFFSIPLGVLIWRMGRSGRFILYLTGVLQTIPSIALLAFMIPIFGVGVLPAVVALFLYALLPILRNTTVALQSVDPVVRNVALGMGLTFWQRLRYVELSLAAPTILAGLRVATVVSIGTATLAAFIGAGGLGEPIVTGLALNDTRLVLEGAIPAAGLAIITELGFEWVERRVVPRHLLVRHE